MDFNELNPNLQEKARACKTAEELLALAKSEGLQLSDDDLDAISGGMPYMTPDPCPCDNDDNGPE